MNQINRINYLDSNLSKNNCEFIINISLNYFLTLLIRTYLFNVFYYLIIKKGLSQFFSAFKSLECWKQIALKNIKHNLKINY